MLNGWLLDNQFAVGMITGVVGNFLMTKVVPAFFSYIKELERFFTTTITVNNNDDLYYYRFVELYFRDKITKRNFILNGKEDNLGYGVYFIWKESPILITKTRHSQQNRHYDEIVIKSWFNKNLLTKIKNFIEETSERDNVIEILTGNPPYELSSFIRPIDKNRKLLTQNQIDLFNGIKDFFENPKSKLTYLLSGEPGQGKSRAVLNIAHLLKKDITIVNINKNTTIFSLRKQILDASNRIVILEDIDRIPISQEDTTADYEINKGDLLNVFDGIIEINKCVIIATTNHKDKLDPALIRPGRFDNHIEFTNPTREDLCRIRDIYGLDDSFVDKNLGKSLAKIMSEIKE